jgi:hypothetical protein
MSLSIWHFREAKPVRSNRGDARANTSRREGFEPSVQVLARTTV